MNVEEHGSVDCTNFKLNFTSTPDVLGVANVNLLASLDQRELMALFPLGVGVDSCFVFYCLFGLIILRLDVIAHCLVNQFVLFELLLPNVLSTHRTSL